ncbi:hypothetical protein [Flammeovirga sp. EKP202]|uniref:hypothetical protein n=1 Tax=Flammeovirga sp. EKP202 TaxID=2770592 RepID=UPI00165F8097|nr:hypothetical protein [Flammeovirga sp. EKP202]MBD0404966.1 hypothetical protein [Flammeovirga sp. EKP202]
MLISYQEIKVVRNLHSLDRAFVVELFKKALLLNPFLFQDKKIYSILLDTMDDQKEFSNYWFIYLFDVYRLHLFFGIDIDFIVKNDFDRFHSYWLDSRSNYPDNYFDKKSEKLIPFISNPKVKEHLVSIIKMEKANRLYRDGKYDEALTYYHELDSSLIKSDDSNYNFYIKLSLLRMINSLKVKKDYDFQSANYIEDHYKEYHFLRNKNDFKILMLKQYIHSYHNNVEFQKAVIYQFDHSILKEDLVLLLKEEVEIIKMYIDYCIQLKTEKKYKEADYYLKRCKSLFYDNIDFIDAELQSRSN